MTDCDDDVAACRSCGAEVVWGTNVSTGSAMPIDVEPSDIGNVSRYDELRGPQFVVLPPRKASAMRACGQQLFLSHFATCPHADSWRRGKAQT